MKSFAIVVKYNNISESGYRELKDSYDKYGHEEGIEPHYATELDKVENIASANGLGKGTLYTPEGIILRIPPAQNIQNIIETINNER